jgi:hypothetical protein
VHKGTFEEKRIAERRSRDTVDDPRPIRGPLVRAPDRAGAIPGRDHARAHSQRRLASCRLDRRPLSRRGRSRAPSGSACDNPALGSQADAPLVSSPLACFLELSDGRQCPPLESHSALPRNLSPSRLPPWLASPAWLCPAIGGRRSCGRYQPHAQAGVATSPHDGGIELTSLRRMSYLMHRRSSTARRAHYCMERL